MVNEKSLENLRPNVFSKDNQPSPEAKRKPKYKTQLKKFIEDNIDVVKEQMIKGNSKFWDIAFERGYGKVKQEIKLSGNLNNKTEEEIKKELEELRKRQQNVITGNN